MKIDLSKVIAYSKDCLKSRAQMRSIMMDMYPGETREMNVLLAVYESGIPRTIKREGKINETQYKAYVKKIASDYGLNEEYVIDALNAWIDICIKPGAASVLKSAYLNGMVLQSNSYTKPINHNSEPIVCKKVVGHITDFEVNDIGMNKVEIRKYIGFDQVDTIIPTEINGKPVVGIGANAFKQCKGIQRLIIPEGIEYISEGAFCDCSNLKMVILPTTLSRLGSKVIKRSSFDVEGAFQGTAITEIDLPNSIETIGARTFCSCEKLSKVVFPDELRTIDDWAFAYCENLTEIELPLKVKRVGLGAFMRCRKMSKVTLNEGLMSIDGAAFEDTVALRYLVIPRSVTSFGSNVFGRYNSTITIGCYPGSKVIEYARENNLSIKPLMHTIENGSQNFTDALSNIKPIKHLPKTSIVLPEDRTVSTSNDYETEDIGLGLIEIKKYIGFDKIDTIIPTEINGKRVVGIGANAFKQCKGIQRLIIPEGIEYISEGAFCDCSNLKMVILPTTLSRLGSKVIKRSSFDVEGAFQGTAITEIDLPNSIETIGARTFCSCEKLSKVVFPDELRTIDDWAFAYCENLTEIELPLKVKRVGLGAFMRCRKMSKVTLNEGLMSIDGAAFEDTVALRYLVIPRSVTSFGSNAFGRYNSTITIGCYPGSKAIEYARNNNLKIVDATK